MEKIAQNKQTNKQTNDQIHILRLKESFFPQTACSPLSFPQIWTLSRQIRKVLKLHIVFIRIRDDSVQRLQKHAVSVSRFTGFVWTKG